MAHVELSVTDPLSGEPLAALDRWADVVRSAVEPCLVLDHQLRVVAVSPVACALLGFGTPLEAAGQGLLDGMLRLRDFTSQRAELSDAELEKIPPVLAVTSGRLARGLLRVDLGSEVVTLDAVATPLLADESIGGSLSFFERI